VSGLLAEPDRTLGGHRLYPIETVTVLRVIKAAQRLGFSLQEVADLITPSLITEHVSARESSLRYSTRRRRRHCPSGRPHAPAEFGAGVDVEFAIDAGEVGLHRFWADE
jgi:hypothetical protein